MKLYEIQLSDETTEVIVLSGNDKLVKSFYNDDLQFLTADTVNKYNLKAGMEKSDIENWEEIKEEAKFAENHFGVSYMIDIDKLDENALFFDDYTYKLYSVQEIREWEVTEYIYSYVLGVMYKVVDKIELEMEEVKREEIWTGDINVTYCLKDKKIVVQYSQYQGVRNCVLNFNSIFELKDYLGI